MLEFTVSSKGPSLDDLDRWGSLDSLPWSLDDERWKNARLMRIKGQDVQKAFDRPHVATILYSPGAVSDFQCTCDKAEFNLHGWGWVPVSEPDNSQWKRVG